MKPSIPQANPLANYMAHRHAIDDAIKNVLEGGRYILGEQVNAFSEEFAAYLAVNSAIGVGNGTDAILLALRACKIGPGDLVYTVSHTAVAPVAAVEIAGAKPVLIDIDPSTFTLDPNCLETALKHPPKGKPKAVICVHLYGHPCDLPAILDIARRFGLYVIEDCAQSHGATLNDRKTGAWGDIAAFSFYPTKNLGALGDGGMVVTNNPSLAERVRLLQQYGWRERYISDIPGLNSRLDEIQAAVLRIKLRHLDDENEQRRSVAARYTKALTGSEFMLPQCSKGSKHVYHQYVVRCQQRDALRVFLNQNGIGSLVHYPQPIHQQPAYINRIATAGRLAHTEHSAATVLSLPMFPELTDTQLDYITEKLCLWKHA